jgi:methylated-DNA-[protein]-cysteine S-methyltransferase
MAASGGFCVFDTAIGPCGMAWEDAVVIGVQLPEGDADHTQARMSRRFPQLSEVDAPEWVAGIAVRIARLLAGEQDDLLDVPLTLDRVPAFNRRVYEITRAIPPGRTLTYGEVAQQIGEPGASRAVGQALGHNPFAPVVPCHRVLAAGHAGGGFSAQGGVETKLRMLQIEHAQFGADPGLFD